LTTAMLKPSRNLTQPTLRTATNSCKVDGVGTHE
jgi:hypothetical protein